MTAMAMAYARKTMFANVIKALVKKRGKMTLVWKSGRIATVSILVQALPTQWTRARTPQDMEGELHTDFWKSEINRDIQKS